jgi:hypothetical protein
MDTLPSFGKIDNYTALLEPRSTHTPLNHPDPLPQVHVHLRHHTHDRQGYLPYIQVLLFVLFIRYRNNDENVRKSVSIFGNVFEINGRLSDNNPISRILSGQGMLASGFRS